MCRPMSHESRKTPRLCIGSVWGNVIPSRTKNERLLSPPLSLAKIESEAILLHAAPNSLKVLRWGIDGVTQGP